MTVAMMPSARAQLNPSPIARLTDSPVLQEIRPHISGNAPVTFFSAGNGSIKDILSMDVSVACAEAMLARVTRQAAVDPTAGMNHLHPSVSSDGVRAVLAIPIDNNDPAPDVDRDRFELRLVDVPSGTVTFVRDVFINNVLLGARGPRETLSGSGRFVYFRETNTSATAPADLTIRFDLDDPNPATRECNVLGNIRLAETQSASSFAGDMVVGVRDGVAPTFRPSLRRVRFTGTGCAQEDPDLILAQGSIVGAPPLDVTVSADGKVAAWSSLVRHCDNPDAPAGNYEATNTLNNIWIWKENGASEPGAADQCALSGSPHRMYLVGPTPTLFNDRSPAISADGRRVVFISTRDETVGTTNPNMRPSLFVVDVSSPAVWPLRNATPGLCPNETVFHASISANGRHVAFTMTRDVDGDCNTAGTEAGLYFVDLEGGTGAPLVPDAANARPSHVPLQVDALTCTVGSGAVNVSARVAQFRGGSRNLVVGFEVTDAATGARAFGGPFVQPMADDRSATLAASIPASATAGTCRAFAIDGGAVQADAAVANATF
jgi:hypothetical protein